MAHQSTRDALRLGPCGTNVRGEIDDTRGIHQIDEGLECGVVDQFSYDSRVVAERLW